MIIKLNSDGTIEMAACAVPEPLDNVYVSYIFPRGLNHLQPVLTWGKQVYKGDNIHIQKDSCNFNMKVTLYDGDEIFKEYRTKEEPTIYIGYCVDKLLPNLLKRLSDLERENTQLKERGDIV